MYIDVDQTMHCCHSLERYRTVLFCGAVCLLIQCRFNVLLRGPDHVVQRVMAGKLLKSNLRCHWVFFYYYPK